MDGRGPTGVIFDGSTQVRAEDDATAVSGKTPDDAVDLDGGATAAADVPEDFEGGGAADAAALTPTEATEPTKEITTEETRTRNTRMNSPMPEQEHPAPDSPKDQHTQ